MVQKKLKNFSIAQICDSGQCFRMVQEENRYCIVAGNRYLEIEQEKDEVIFYCSEEEYDMFWKDYFDLEVDYTAYHKNIEADTYLYRAIQYGDGIRILKQDLWEMIITFIISQQNNIKRIRKCIETISMKYGVKKTALSGREYYAFPTPESLAQATEEELRACGLGYRSKYIVKTAADIRDGVIDFSGIQNMSYEAAKKELLKLYGIGEKVADCICLFALHKLEAFPVDVHIKRVLETQYPNGFPFEQYKEYAGVIQQYIFYYDLNMGSV
ncbi:MAG: 8-oxoguanine DNA glycosylase [Candidatus Ruminococcus intestinipullorum]|nr:8-oxoguanine DNA glycosylase [Candidatus Ruminococcus intestinipullorum]